MISPLVWWSVKENYLKLKENYKKPENNIYSNQLSSESSFELYDFNYIAFISKIFIIHYSIFGNWKNSGKIHNLPFITYQWWVKQDQDQYYCSFRLFFIYSVVVMFLMVLTQYWYCQCYIGRNFVESVEVSVGFSLGLAIFYQPCYFFNQKSNLSIV